MMKKIVALLLSILMLLGMAAVAEEALDPALVSHISNIAIGINENGEANTINLEGFEAFLSIDTADGLALVAQAFNGDDSLALAVAKLVGTQLHLAIDGVDKTFAADVPQLEGQDTAALGEMLRPALPALLNVQLPKINVPSLPKLDITPIVGMFGTETDGDTTTFSIPSEIIDTLLDQVIEAVKSSGQNIPGLDQGLALAEQLRASGMSVALAGQVVDAADQQTTTLEIYPVSESQTADDAVAVLTFATAQDALLLTVDVPSGEENMTVANLNLQTDADENSFIATLDIAGMMQFNLAAFPEDDLQKVVLTMESAIAGGFDLTLTYGKNGADDLFDIAFDAGEDMAFELTSNTAAVADDATEGTLELTAAMEGSTFHVTADIEEFLGSVDLGYFTMPGTIVPINELSDEANSTDLQTALQPLVEYFSQIVMDAAA